MTELQSDEIEALLGLPAKMDRRRLDAFLADYARQTVEEAGDISGRRGLDIWTPDKTEWTRMPTAGVQSLLRDSTLKKQSLCKTYFVDGLKLNAEEYNDAKHNLNAMKPQSPVGIYVNPTGRYAVVLGHRR